MNPRRGFTMIELMIVIAIIAVIAAIAIPGLLQSQRAGNERNASASLKTLATAEADFKSNDRDGNKSSDYWTRDVSGLYTVYPPGATSSAAIKLIELSIAGADAVVFPAMAPGAVNPGSSLITTYQPSQPKSFYWYFHLTVNLSTVPAGLYATSTDGTGLAIHNVTAFGFGCYPDSWSAGRQIFIINEGNTLYRRQCIATVRPGPAIPPGLPSAAGVNNGAADLPSNWPTDANLRADYGKMD